MPRKQRMPLSEFLRRFGTDESCRDYLAVQRWPEGFVCPKCGHKHGTRLPSIQRPVPVHSLPPSDLRHSWDCPAP